MILAEENGELIGGAIIGMQSPLSWPDGRKCELFILGVLPEFRKLGIGKSLLKKAEEIAKGMGAKSVIINTNALMKRTEKFYLDNGYQNIGMLKGYYGNGDAVFLLKVL